MRSELLWRAVAWLCCAYAGAVLAWSLVPAERWLPRSLAYGVGAQGCSRGELLVRAARDPDVAARMLPIVMARDVATGPENAIGAESCDMIATKLRDEEPWLEAVPRRFLCARVRAWAHDAYESEARALGGELWIREGRVVPLRENYDFVRSLGLEYRRKGSRYFLVVVAPG